MNIFLGIVAIWVLAGLTHLAIIAATRWNVRRDLMKSPPVGFVTIGGQTYNVVPLTLNRMDALLTALTGSLDPAKPYTIERTAEAMVKVVSLAAPRVPKRALNAASGVELQRAFDHVLNLYRLGSK